MTSARAGRHSRYHHDHPAVDPLEGEPVGPQSAVLFRTLHPHDAHETAERNECELVSGLADSETEKRGSETDGKRGDRHAGPLRRNQVSQFVHQDQHVRDQQQKQDSQDHMFAFRMLHAR